MAPTRAGAASSIANASIVARPRPDGRMFGNGLVGSVLALAAILAARPPPHG